MSQNVLSNVFAGLTAVLVTTIGCDSRQTDYQSRNGVVKHRGEPTVEAREKVPVAVLARTMLTDPSREARWRALESLLDYGHDAKSQLPSIREMVKEEIVAGGIRGEAPSAARFAKFEDTGLWVLQEWIADPADTMNSQYWALRSLAFMARKVPRSPKIKTTVPALIKLVQHRDEEVRHLAISILGDLRSDATEALPELRKVIDQIPSSALYAAAAICSIEPTSTQALQYLRSAIENKDDKNLAEGAIQQLVSLPPHEHFVPVLLAALKNDNPYIRREAILGLNANAQAARLPDLTRRVVFDVKNALNDESEEVRKAASFVLDGLEEKSRQDHNRAAPRTNTSSGDSVPRRSRGQPSGKQRP
jgi:HEAT repeat protein